ncbi:MAG: MFS transporter [Sedimentisphaerales bacterium]|nr:MFS transporter [Sedimentisphaerales bacterium]MBN2842354.1 MFS transporter [Sedimentisphaerales bacterium]
MKLKVVPILMAFFAMGVADAMGPMSNAVKENYQLSNVMATLLPFFVFIAFAAFSVPAGLLAARIGMKKLLLVGLGLNIIAMLVPCIITPSFPLLVGCIFLLGVGTTLLQVAGNPIMRDVSAEGAYSSNLSFAQGFKGIGSTVSAYLVTMAASIAVLANLGWRAAFPLFCGLMVIVFIWVMTLKIEEQKADVPPSIGSSMSLLGKPVFALAVLGIFLYVGAEVCMTTFTGRLLESIGMTAENASKYGAALFLAMLTIGRLTGGVVLKFISPRNFFRLSAALGLAGGIVLMLGNSNLAVVGVGLAGLGFANIWPMLFSITVEEDPKRGGELSGLMCMAISGGAIVPLLMGKFVDDGQGTKAFIVPVVCFAYLLVLSLKGSAKKAA